MKFWQLVCVVLQYFQLISILIVANGTHVILCEHTNTERGFFSQVFQDRLQQELNQDTQQQMLQVVVSKTDRDPIETVTLSE